jgi:formylmethanofuran:tetrahydromethanopterin formyltransferase
MENKPLSEWFRPLIFLESIPTLQKPCQHVCTNTSTPTNKTTPSAGTIKSTCLTISTLRKRAILLRARVEKGKELASEIERRMQRVPVVRFPTHFCHTCVQDGESVEVLLTKCGHRVCRTCLEFGVDKRGAYVCSICFVVAGFVARRGVGCERGVVGGNWDWLGDWYGYGDREGNREGC